MIAVDTNVIVRLIVGDDETQVAAALALAADDDFYVSFTVVEETEWVLRSRYGFDRRGVVEALSTLNNLVPLVYENDGDMQWALERYARAGELADYLHIATARIVGRFATFEKKLARRAGAQSPVPVQTLG